MQVHDHKAKQQTGFKAVVNIPDLYLGYFRQKLSYVHSSNSIPEQYVALLYMRVLAMHQ